MAIIKSGATSDQLTVDATSKAARATIYNSAGREVSLQGKPTYSCTTAGFTPAATATDLAIITGSASKTVRVIGITMHGTATAAGVQDIYLVKRSSANSGGTFVAGSVVGHDSSDPASTVTIGHYTANPAALGTTVGTLRRNKIFLPILATAVAVGEQNYLLHPIQTSGQLNEAIVLNGTAEALAVNNAAAAIPAGGANWYVTFVWTEE